MDAATDPFAADQQALEEKLRALQRNCERWRQIRGPPQAGGGAGDQGGDDTSAELLRDELRWLCGDIQRSVKSLAWEVNDLQETLTAMREQQQQPQQQLQHSNRAIFLSNARASLDAIEAELAGAPVGRAGDFSASAASVAPAAAAADSDVQLLLESPSGPQQLQPGTLRARVLALLRRHRGRLICGCVIIGVGFILWILYEAVLSGGRNPSCVCKNGTIAEVP